MRLLISTYWPAILLALVPAIWIAQRWTETDMSPKHLRLAGIVRSLIVILLTFALMQPVIYRTGAWMSVVYLVDISQSVAPASIQAALEWVAQADREGRPDQAAYVPFSSNSVTLETLDALKSVEIADRPGQQGIDQGATNIEDALDRAARALGPNHLKRLVLLTDGNQNAGDVKNILPKLKHEGIRVFTVPAPVRANRDLWVENILVPTHATAEELFPVDVHVYSQAEADAELELLQGEKSLGKRTLKLVPGLNRVAFEVQIKDTGPITLDADLRSASDAFKDNNRFRQSLVVLGKPRILYVEGRQESAHYLADVLQRDGLVVDTVSPEAVPATLQDLDRYDAIIVSDVPRSSIADAQMQNLAAYVGNLGGGFIMAGGESNFGEGGYSETIVEEILPVKFDLKKKQEEPSVAMIVVLDKSGSMGGQKIELAKEATKAAVGVLRDEDQFGVVAFDYNFYWPVRLQSVANRGPILQSISTIIAGGETNIYPALREAYIQLFTSPSQIKHVILLSDGRSLPDDYQGLVAKMSEAKMTVSSVAVGSGADRELLENIANWGKGRSYFIEDATKVPQIFTQETQLATKGTLREEPFKPVVKKQVDAFKGIDFNQAPQLLGYVSTQSKETSEVLLESTDKDPILARWQYGLGKTVAFTSDVKDRWSAEWLTWSGYAKLWPQLVRETMRRQDTGEFDFRVTRSGTNADVRINAIDREGSFRNLLQTDIQVVAPDQTTRTIRAQQVGPGSYQTAIELQQKGTYLFRAVGSGTSGSASQVLTYSYPEELHFYPPNTDMLRSVSEQTGGKFQPEPREVFDPQGQTTSLPTPLWPLLAAAALLLYLGDVLLRRVRLFDEV